MADSRLFQAQAQSHSLRRALVYGGIAAISFFLMAFGIGMIQGKSVLALSLIGISIVLEAQPAAVASIPMGFHPMSGALISILANLVPIPLMMLTFDQIVARWSWVNRKLKRAEKWSEKYGRYGVWVLALLSPFIGAYLCVVIGCGMRWPLVRMFISVTVGVVASACFITFGGHVVVGLFR